MGRLGLLAGTDHCRLWLLCRPDFIHLLLLLCFSGCCDHSLHVHAISDHQPLYADLHWTGENSWWVCPNGLCCQKLLDRNLFSQHVQPQLTSVLPDNNRDSIIKSKIKMAVGKLWSFSFLIVYSFMGINTTIIQEWANISKTCFHCQELWSDPSPIVLTSTSTFLNLTLGSIMWLA